MGEIAGPEPTVPLQHDLSFLGFLLGLPLGSAWHEIGHVLAAGLVGLRVRQVVLGSGPVLCHMTVRGIRFELGGVPLGGITILRPALRRKATAELLFLLGGVSANLLLALLLAPLARAWWLFYPVRTMLGGIVAAQGLLIILNLLPWSGKGWGGRVWTDGLQILRLLWRWRSGLTPLGELYLSRLRHYDAAAGPALLGTAGALRLVEAHSEGPWGDPGVRARRRAVIQSLLDEGALAPALELMALDLLATEALLLDEPGCCSSLDAWSGRGLALAPANRRLRHTRGGVLVQMGCYADGLALLEPEPAQGASAFELFLNQLFAAEAHHGLGHREEARRWLGEARRRIEDPSLRPYLPALLARLARAEARIGELEAAAVTP